MKSKRFQESQVLQSQEVKRIQKMKSFSMMTMMTMMSSMKVLEGSMVNNSVSEDWFSFQVIANDLSCNNGTSDGDQRNSQVSKRMIVQKRKRQAWRDQEEWEYAHNGGRLWMVVEWRWCMWFNKKGKGNIREHSEMISWVLNCVRRVSQLRRSSA